MSTFELITSYHITVVDFFESLQNYIPVLLFALFTIIDSI
jgi:hypothetical protein